MRAKYIIAKVIRFIVMVIVAIIALCIGAAMILVFGSAIIVGGYNLFLFWPQVGIFILTVIVISLTIYWAFNIQEPKKGDDDD